MYYYFFKVKNICVCKWRVWLICCVSKSHFNLLELLQNIILLKWNLIGMNSLLWWNVWSLASNIYRTCLDHLAFTKVFMAKNVGYATVTMATKLPSWQHGLVVDGKFCSAEEGRSTGGAGGTGEKENTLMMFLCLKAFSKIDLKVGQVYYNFWYFF